MPICYSKVHWTVNVKDAGEKDAYIATTTTHSQIQIFKISIGNLNEIP